MSTSIRLEHLTKVFTKARGQPPAVDDVSLTVEPGELFFLLGASGCGKTTLIRTIAGFIEPTRGRVFFGDRDITTVPPNRRNTGMVFQSYAIWPHMTVAQNVEFGLKVQGLGISDRRQRVQETLEAVQIAELAGRRPGELSGGQQQRVALARALAVRPEVLLLDEPLSNLDAKLRSEMRSQIRSLCKSSGITAIYVTHDQREALSMADRIAIMRDGRIEQIGPPVELYRRPSTSFAAQFLGDINLLRIEGKVVSPDSVSTAAGAIRIADSINVPPQPRFCAFRPEAASIIEGAGPSVGNVLRGTVEESVYLGEASEHRVKIASDLVLIRELSPDKPDRKGTSVVLSIDPSEIVLLP